MERLLRQQAQKLLKKAPKLAERCNRRHPSSIYEQIVEGMTARCKQLGIDP